MGEDKWAKRRRWLEEYQKRATRDGWVKGLDLAGDKADKRRT